MNCGLPTINVEINGKPAKLLIDTGADSSILDYTADTIYGFRYDKNVPITIGKGLGGISLIYGVEDVVLVHKTDTLNVKFKSTDLSLIRLNSGIIGIIGSDFLYRNNYIIDYKNRNIYIRK